MSSESEFKNLRVSPDTNVAQANALIENKPAMSLHELKLFTTLVASINYDQDHLENIKVPIRQIIDLWDADPKNAYRQVKNALMGLSKKQFQIERTNSDGTKTVEGSSYISSYRFTEGSSIAYISISNVFAPYLISLRANFTTYMLKNVIKLSHPNSIRTYELLSQYKNFGVRKFDVSDYKKKIGISGKYKGNNSNLKKRVLDPVCNEISEKTDIITRATISGRGENAKIEFLIFRKENVPGSQGKIQPRFDSEDFDMLVDLLSKAIKMAEEFTDEEIRKIAEHTFQVIPYDADVSKAFLLCSRTYHDYGISSVGQDIHNKIAYFVKILETNAKELPKI